MVTATTTTKNELAKLNNNKEKNAMDKSCSVYKSNLSGGLTSIEDLRSGASGAGPLNCGVWQVLQRPMWSVHT